MGFDTECILNIQSLPGEYFCPVCHTLIYPNEALQSQCTHLYCKPCLAYIVATTHACPYDGYLVTDADSKPLRESNNVLADAIDKILVYCLYNRSGCQWQGTFSECITHSTGCTFGNSIVVCNRCGTQIMHLKVHEHARHCPGVQLQAQQMDSGQTQTGTSTAQVVAQDQSAATSASLAASAAAGASSAVIVSMPGLTTVAVPVVASSITTAATPASSVTATITATSSLVQSQVNAAAYPQPGNVPTVEQWYQQQQLQYQQYYQQYPGYNPYQQYQQYAQQLAYPQYAQSQMQVILQNSLQGQYILQTQAQPQASQNLQPHLHVQSQPSTQFQPQPRSRSQPQLQAQPPPQPHPHPHPQPYSQLQPQMQPQSQSQLHLQSQPQTQIAQLQPPQQPLPQTSLQPHLFAQGIQIQPQRPQVPAQQIHSQAPPQAHLASLAPGPIQLLNLTHYPQLHLQSHVQGHQQPQAAAHQVPLQSQPNAQVLPQHQQPHLLPQSHAYPSALPQHLIQQSNMHPTPQAIPQGQVQHPSTAVTGHQAYPQPSAIQQIPPGAPPQHPMFVQSQLQITPFQHPQQPSQTQNQFPPQQPPHGHIPIQVQHQSVNPAQASLTGYPHQQHPQHPVQQMNQQSGMHSHAPQHSVLPSQAHTHFKPGQAHSQGLLPQKNSGLSDDGSAPLSALKEATGHEEIRVIRVEVGNTTVVKPEEESNKGTFVKAMIGEFNTQHVHQDNPSKESVPSQHGPSSEAPQNVRPAGLFPGVERCPQQIPYGHPSNFHTMQMLPTQSAMVQERTFQELPPYQMQTQVHAMTPAQIRASGPNFTETFPLQGQPTIIPEPFKPPRGQHSHNSHPFDAPYGGIPGAAPPFSVGPPGHLVPPLKNLSEYETAHCHVQSHMSMQHAARSIDGPPGSLDRPNLKPRGPSFGFNDQIGTSRSIDSRSFLFDGKSDDGAESRVTGTNEGLGGGFCDPASAHGFNDGKFKPFPKEKFGHLYDDGLKVPQDGNMRPFPQNIGRHASSQKNFEEDMKEFPRATIMDGGGIPRFGTMPEQLGPEGMVRPFSGVPPGSDRLSNFPRPGNPFAPSGTSEYHLMDSMKRHKSGALSEDGHHFMEVFPSLRNPGNAHGQNPSYSQEPLGQNQHGFRSEYPFPAYSQEPGQFGLKRKPSNSCRCLICKIDCETIEGLDLHSQTREHQKMTMDVVLSIKKENAKKLRVSDVTTVREEDSKSRKSAFGNKGSKK